MTLQRTQKIIAMFAASALLLLSACSKNASTFEGIDSPESTVPPVTVTTASTPWQPDVTVDTPDQSDQPTDMESQNSLSADNSNHITSPSDLDYTPSVRISLVLEKDALVIAECTDYAMGEDRPPKLYLLPSTKVYDILISRVLENGDGYIERDGLSYIPELLTGQAVVLYDFFGYDDLYRIAYTNDTGNYEAVLLFLNKDGVPELTPIEANIVNGFWDLELYNYYHSYYYYSESGVLPDALTMKALGGKFNNYIPNGFCISNGSLGDVNNDGIEDALICLTTGCHRTVGYIGISPLFILIGQSDGSYVVEQKIPEVLFTRYRSSSYPFAGTGYIDIVYDYVGGAACSHLYANRFMYDPVKNDWFLEMISFQPGYSIDWSEPISPTFINPLPDLIDLPLGQFNRELFYNSQTPWDFFDAVSIITTPSNGDFDVVYTVAVIVNDDTGCYEGYIHKYFKSLDSGGFIQTVRGANKKETNLVVTSNNEEQYFCINDDIWVLYSEDQDAFHLLR